MSSYIGQVIDQALELNLERQMVMQSYRPTYSTMQWLLEFGTVQLNLGRGAGKTTAIRRRARSSDAVIHFSTVHARDFLTESFFKPDCYTLNRYLDPRWRGKRYERIWVDNASLLGQDIGLVYDMAVYTEAKQIILLG